MIDPINIKLLDKFVPKKLNLVICSASFEERCHKIVTTLYNQVSCDKYLILYNSNEYEEINKNATNLQEKMEGSILVELNTNEPVSNTVKINKILNDLLVTSVENIFLDTTTFTHETLLIVFKLLYEKKDRYSNLLMGYIGAKEYSTEESDMEKKWLSSGISTIRSVVGYPGVNSPARENHLIVLVGFEADRTNHLIDLMEFSTISLGFGPEDDSIDVSHQKLNYARHKKLMEKYEGANEFCFSLTDPKEAEKLILEQVSKYPNHNTVIAAMNNKISTIGAGLAAINNPKFQLIYAKPIEYNVKGYSKPSDQVYLYQIDF